MSGTADGFHGNSGHGRWEHRHRLARSLRSALPGLATFTTYRRAWLRTDVVAGITVGAMLVPQGMAYAGLAGMPPEAGLHAALLALVVYALLGTSRHLGVGPEPGTALLAATAVGAVAAPGTAEYAALMATLAVLVGLACVLGAALRLGFLASFLSRPVLVGYLTGVGMTLLASQLAKLTGVPLVSDDPIGQVRELLGELAAIDPVTIGVGTSALAGIALLRWWRPQLPAALLLVGLVTAVAAALSLDEHGLALVGNIPAGLPDLALPDVRAEDMRTLAPAAVGIALVGFADNVLTARSIAGRQGYRIDATRELAALGAVNATSSLSGGFPISSSASRSVVPASLGSKTQLVSLVAAGVLALTLVALGSVLAQIPQAAIGAVIVTAALSIIDVRGFRDLWRIDRFEFGLAVVTAAGVIVFNVLVGVGIAVGASFVLLVARLARPHDTLLAEYPGSRDWVDQGRGGTPVPGVAVYRFESPLVFPNVERFDEGLEQALERNPGTETWVVLDFEGIGFLDTTAVDELRLLPPALGRQGARVVAVARTTDPVERTLRRSGLLAPEGPLVPFPTLDAAMKAFSEWTGDGGERER